MIGKFIQTYFAVDDNVMDKKLLKLVNEKTFTSKKNVKQIINEIVQTVGERFYQGDLQKAKKLLNERQFAISTKSASLIALFFGMSIVMLGQIIFQVLMPLEVGEVRWDLLRNNLPAYRFVIMMILSMILAGVCMTVWNRFKVNYPFILEMDVTYKLTPIDVFRFSSSFVVLWIFCYFGDLIIIKHEYYFHTSSAPFTLLLYIVFFGIILMPFSILYPRIRFTFIKNIG
jgi:hypothetical protein